MTRSIQPTSIPFYVTVVLVGLSSWLTTTRLEKRHNLAGNKLAAQFNAPAPSGSLRNSSLSSPSQSIRYFSGQVISKSTDRLIIRSKGVFFAVEWWPAVISVHPGDRVVLSAQFRAGKKARNPHDFDEQSFARQKGWLGFLMSPTDIVVDHSGHHGSLAYLRHSVRSAIKSRIERRFSNAIPRSIVHALILADKSLIPQEISDYFKATGLGHLLAISGLHMGIIAGFVHIGIWVVFRRVRMAMIHKHRISAYISVTFVVSFAVLVGLSPSVFRSAIMILLVVFLGVSHRQIHPTRALGCAFLLILLVRPTDLFTVGFWLSFAAVGGILFLVTEIGRRDASPTIFSRIYSAFLVSLAAVIGTAPVLLYSFGSVPLITLIVSPIAVFLLGLTLPITLLALLFPASISSFSVTADLLINSIVQLAQMGTNNDWLGTISAPVHSVPHWILPVFYAVLLMVYIKRRFIRRGILVGWVCWSMGSLLLKPNLPTITFFDVGQGDAALFHLPNKATLLVDVGPGDRSGRTIANHLNAKGTKPPLSMVFSHGHADHVGGSPLLLSTLASFFENQIKVFNGGWLQDSSFLTHELKRGQQLDMGQSARAYILHPSQPGFDNDDSVVILLRYGPTTILLMGDAEAATEEQLIGIFRPILTADILKVGHHGSRTSTTNAFIQKVNPTYSVISSGNNNWFGHPHAEVIESLQHVNSTLFETARHGAIQFQLSRQGINNITTQLLH